MTFRKWHILFFLLCFCTPKAFSDTQPYVEEFDSLQLQYEKISQLNVSIDDLQQRLNQKGQNISELKEKKDPSFFENLQLQKRMQEAQTLSKELDGLYGKRALLEDQLKNQQRSVLRAIETDLTQAHVLTKEQTESLMNMHKKVSSLHAPKNITQEAPVVFQGAGTGDASDMEQWIVLKDLQIYTQDLITDTQQLLAYEKQQRRLKKELRHLLNEEMFFGEQGFIQGTVRKQNPLAAQAGTQDGADGASAEVEPGQESEPSAPVEEPVDPEIDPIDDIGTEDIDVGDVALDTPDVLDTSSPVLDDIDPKSQTFMLDSIFPEVNLESVRQAGSDQEDFGQQRLESINMFDDPKEIADALVMLSPRDGESKEAFLQRKIQYLEEILLKLEQSSKRFQDRLEGRKVP